MELGNLVNLECLSNFPTKNCNVKDLHQMIRLQTLIINYNGGCTMETLSSSLSELDWVHYVELHLTAVMLKLPDERHFLSNLTYIALIRCQLTEDPMPILEKLLQLKWLDFFQDSFYGRRIFCSGSGFPKLQDLYIQKLQEWEEWIIEEGAMPLLNTLCIYECPKLKKLPDGLRFITSLKKLLIYTGPSSKPEEWKDRFSEGGEDYNKVQHIPSVEVYE